MLLYMAWRHFSKKAFPLSYNFGTNKDDRHSNSPVGGLAGLAFRCMCLCFNEKSPEEVGGELLLQLPTFSQAVTGWETGQTCHWHVGPCP